VTISQSLRHGVALTALLLSPILGWNGIIVAVGIVFYLLKKGLIRQPSIGQFNIAQKVLVCSVVLYFFTCIFSDIIHNPASGIWNQLKSLIPLVAFSLYILSPDKIKTSPELLGTAGRITVTIIFSLMLLEHINFNVLKSNPSYRSHLLSGNPLHISLWIPAITLICFADYTSASLKKVLSTLAITALSIVCLAHFLQARASLLALLAILPVGLYLTGGSIMASTREASNRGKRIIFLLSILAVVATFISAISFAPERVKQITFSPINYVSNAKADSSAETRIAYWKAGVQAIEKRPWVGYGASNEGDVLKDLVSKSVEIHLHAHQQFISFGIAGGVTAIVAGALFLLLPIFFSLLQRSEPPVLLMCAALSSTVIMISLTDSLISNKRHAALFMLFFAIIASISQTKQKSERNSG
jgi:O-antigen ligase